MLYPMHYKYSVLFRCIARAALHERFRTQAREFLIEITADALIAMPSVFRAS